MNMEKREQLKREIKIIYPEARNVRMGIGLQQIAKISYDEVQYLTKGIASIGAMHPIIVYPDKHFWVVISGKRRLRAMKLLEYKKIPVAVWRYSDSGPWETVEGKLDGPSDSPMYLENVCVICHKPFSHEHHILPRKDNGEKVEANLVDLCPYHHRALHFLYSSLPETAGHKAIDEKYKNHDTGKKITSMLNFFADTDPLLMTYYYRVVVPILRMKLYHRKHGGKWVKERKSLNALRLDSDDNVTNLYEYWIKLGSIISSIIDEDSEIPKYGILDAMQTFPRTYDIWGELFG